MRNNKINYLAVGSFVILMVVGLVLSIAMLTGRTGATDEYHAYYSNVTGVKFGTQVLYEGYPIGQVETVTPEPGEGGMRFRVDFEVTEGWKIPENSKVQIAASSLLAAVSLNIKAGTATVPLKPGDEVSSQEAANIFSVVSDVAGTIGDLAETSIKPMLVDIGKSAKVIGELLDEDGRVIFGEMKDLAKRAPAIADDVEAFANQMNNSSAKLDQLMSDENVKQLETLIDNLNAFSTDLKTTQAKLDTVLMTSNNMLEENRKDVRKAVTELRYTADSVVRHIDAVTQNLEGSSRNMYEFTRQIRQNPAILLGGTPPQPAR